MTFCLGVWGFILQTGVPKRSSTASSDSGASLPAEAMEFLGASPPTAPNRLSFEDAAVPTSMKGQTRTIWAKNHTLFVPIPLMYLAIPLMYLPIPLFSGPLEIVVWCAQCEVRFVSFWTFF